MGLHHEGTAELPLCRQDGSLIAVALIDAADFEWLSQWRWIENNGYAARGKYVEGRTRHLYMHRLILGLEFGDPRQADHVNMNKLDNRRANLRIATPAQNQQNAGARRGSASRFRGVHRQKNRWIAKGRLNGQRFYIGCFETEEEAGRAAAEWRREYMPFSAEARGLAS